MDFFLGNYEWNSLNRSPFQDSIQMKVRVIPIILIVAFSMVIIGTILPPSKFQWHSNFLSYFRKRKYHLEQVAHLGPRWYPWLNSKKFQNFWNSSEFSLPWPKKLKKSPKSNIYLGESFFDQIMFILFWFGLMVGSILHVIRNGPEYVNQPLLVQTLIRDKWLESVYCI